MLHSIFAIVSKDLKIELRSKVLLGQVIPIIGAFMIIFGFSFGPSKDKLESVASGVVWISILLSTLLISQRSFTQEAHDDASESLLLLGIDSSELFIAKSVLAFLEILVLGIANYLGVIIITSPTNITLKAVIFASVSLLLGAGALAFISTLYGAMTFLSTSKDTLMPLLFLPVASPILLAANELTLPLFGGVYPSALTWIGLLAVLAITYFALGLIAFEIMVEER